MCCMEVSVRFSTGMVMIDRNARFIGAKSSVAVAAIATTLTAFAEVVRASVKRAVHTNVSGGFSTD